MIFKSDKLKHFFFGFCIYAIFVGAGIPDWIALMGVSLIATAKEVVWDGLMKRGTPEFLDWAMTIAPAFIWYCVYYLGNGMKSF